MTERDGTDLGTLCELYECVRELKAHRDRLEQKARETFLQSLSDEGQYEENYQARLAAEARLARAMRYFHLANIDRRFAWNELRRENELSVETRKELTEAQRRVESLQAGLEMERRINAMNGCPDCGVHAGCDEVVAQRERFREVLAAVEEHWARVTVLDPGDSHAKSIDEWFKRLHAVEGT